MDKTVYISLLFDFYGELLTEKQKEYVDLYFNDNLSLSEIAENDGISRQGVRDILVRAEATLTETEKKTKAEEAPTLLPTVRRTALRTDCRANRSDLYRRAPFSAKLFCFPRMRRRFSVRAI